MPNVSRGEAKSSGRTVAKRIPPIKDVNYSEWTRLGWVNPTAAFGTTAMTLYKITPKKVLWVFSCLTIEELNKESFERNLAVTDQRVQETARAGAQFIIVGGTPVIRMKGVGFDRELIARLEALTGVPTTTSQTAGIDALRHLGVKRLAVATPYEKALNEDVRKFLEGSGFSVLALKGLNKRSALDIANTPSKVVYQTIKDAAQEGSKAEAVYVPCIRWPVVENIARLEAEFGIPVAAVAPSILWAALRRLGWKGEPITGYGRLLEELGS